MAGPTYFNTPARAIEYAMRHAGLLAEGVEPTSEQLARYSNTLNDLINLWMVKDGLKLWTWTDQSVTLTASDGSYTIMSGGDVSVTKPWKVVDAYYLDSSGGWRPVTLMSWTDWLPVSQNTDTGSITRIFVEKLTDRLVVHTNLIPDSTEAAGTLHLIIQQQITNFTGLTDTLNFSAPWFMALQWGLADQICTGQPPLIMQRCESKAEYYYSILSNADVEDVPTSFYPEGCGVPGRFV